MKPNPAQQAMAARLLLATEMERDYSVTAERLRDESWPDDRFPLSTQAAIRALAARELTAAQGVIVIAWLCKKTRKEWNSAGTELSSVTVGTTEIATTNVDAEWYRKMGYTVIPLADAAALSQPIEPQSAVVVTDAMKQAAAKVVMHYLTGEDSQPSTKFLHIADDILRAALEAALPVAVGAGEDQDGKRYRYLVEANEIPEAVSLGIFMSNKEMTDFAIDAILTTGEMQ